MNFWKILKQRRQVFRNLCDFLNKHFKLGKSKMYIVLYYAHIIKYHKIIHDTEIFFTIQKRTVTLNGTSRERVVP